MVKKSSSTKPVGGQSSGNSKPSTSGSPVKHNVVKAGDSSKSGSSSPGPKAPKK